jgi:CheY-like chemotaxis protein
MRLGGKVRPALTSGEALAWAAGGGRCDFVVIGTRLPGLDSNATARALRGLPDYAGVPLIGIVPDEGAPAELERELFAALLARRSAAAELPATIVALLSRGGEEAQAAPLRVLVVEDNPINQAVTERLLARLGHAVTIAPDGRSALEAIGRCSFEVVLMDIQMPDLDGVEVTVRIRALGATIAQPWIIALTASALRGDRERYLAAGMDDYLGKPVQLEDLERALRRSRPGALLHNHSLGAI